MDSLLSLSEITKHFGAVRALSGVDFSLEQGEVHALLGENGAGKSTLLQVAYGMTAPDAGRIRVRGREVRLGSPRGARGLGIGMVHQHFTSIGELTVRENIELAAGGRMGGWADGRLADGLDPKLKAGDLPVGLRQRLEVVKALAAGAEILLLDEPSAVLAPAETEELLARIREFVREGGAAALVTHKLGEVFAAADRVTVLRQGAVIMRGKVAEQTPDGLAAAMIGPGPDGPGERKGQGGGVGSEVARVGGIPVFGGELVGVAAIEGHGHRDLLRSIAGVGQGFGSESVAVTGPVALVPEDRTTEGLIGEMSVAENLVLGQDADPRWSRGGWIRWDAVRSHASLVMDAFRVRVPSPDAPAATLSGGNQQKLMLGRVLGREPLPRILVAENPTRGLDIRATAEVQERLRGAARAGVAVLVYSSDLDEVLDLADRVLVVREGRVREAPAGASRRVVGEMMLGLEP